MEKTIYIYSKSTAKVKLLLNLPSLNTVPTKNVKSHITSNKKKKNADKLFHYQ